MEDQSAAEQPRPLISPPIAFSGVIASSARLYVARWKVLMPMIFLILLTAFTLGIATSYLLNLAGGVGTLLLVLLLVVGSSLGFAVASCVLENAVASRKVGVRACISDLRPRLKELLRAALVSAAIALAVVVFLGPLGLVMMWLFSGPPILVQVISLESADVQDGWMRTRALMRGHWPRVLLYLVCVVLGLSLLGGVFAYAVLSAIAETISTPSPLVVTLIQIVAYTLTLPYLAAAGFSCYWDVRERAESAE